MQLKNYKVFCRRSKVLRFWIFPSVAYYAAVVFHDRFFFLSRSRTERTAVVLLLQGRPSSPFKPDTKSSFVLQSGFLLRDQCIACHCDPFCFLGQIRVYCDEMDGELIIEKTKSQVGHDDPLLHYSRNVAIRSYDEHSNSMKVLCDCLVLVLRNLPQFLKHGVNCVRL